jgi:hypothetical protein
MSTATLSKDGDQYRYQSATATYTIWKFRSDYGDNQWGCDVRYHDGRTIDTGYAQGDRLADIRHFVETTEETR